MISRRAVLLSPLALAFVPAVSAQSGKMTLAVHQNTSLAAGYRGSLEGWSRAGVRGAEIVARQLDEFLKTNTTIVQGIVNRDDIGMVREDISLKSLRASIRRLTPNTGDNHIRSQGPAVGLTQRVLLAAVSFVVVTPASVKKSARTATDKPPMDITTPPDPPHARML